MTDNVYMDQFSQQSEDADNIPDLIAEKDFSKGLASTLGSKNKKQKILLSNPGELGSSSNETTTNRNRQEAHKKRLEQNRQSAKKSRMKKKQLLNELEEKTKSLTQQLEYLKLKIVESKINLQKYITQNNTIDGFNIGRKQTYDRLAELLKDEKNCDQDELNLLLNTLKYRIGVTGKQRQATQNYYFKKMIDVCIPPLPRYALWSGSEKLEYFREGETISEVDWTQQLINILQLTPQQKQKVLSRSDPIKAQKQYLEVCLNKLRTQKTQFDTESANLQNFVEQMGAYLSPIQISKCILFIERYKYKKQFDLWLENDEDREIEKKITKKIKLQHN